LLAALCARASASLRAALSFARASARAFFSDSTVACSFASASRARFSATAAVDAFFAEAAAADLRGAFFAGALRVPVFAFA